ncbi:hypothetical protein HPP92_016016 [Vanilla planifolia]|uniref:Uncharacterized protein n=1 Tax=Vanilla planifolia TaxID=51239 RepID=A0A835USK4_VANPL|nr:hypothetical protein HPP92_016016 [Vanilla planifolia]
MEKQRLENPERGLARQLLSSPLKFSAHALPAHLSKSKREKGSSDPVPEKTNVKSPRGRKPIDWTRKNPRKPKGRSASRHLNWNITDDDHLNEPVTISEEATPQAIGRRKHPRFEFGDTVDETIPKRRKSKSKGSKKSMNDSSKPKEMEKSKDDSSAGKESKKSRSVSYRPRENKKSNGSSPANGNSKKSKRVSSKLKESKKSNGDSRADKKSRKRPADAHVPVIESKRGPRKIKSVKRLQKPGQR